MQLFLMMMMMTMIVVCILKKKKQNRISKPDQSSRTRFHSFIPTTHTKGATKKIFVRVCDIFTTNNNFQFLFVHLVCFFFIRVKQQKQQRLLSVYPRERKNYLRIFVAAYFAKYFVRVYVCGE